MDGQLLLAGQHMADGQQGNGYSGHLQSATRGDRSCTNQHQHPSQNQGGRSQGCHVRGIEPGRSGRGRSEKGLRQLLAPRQALQAVVVLEEQEEEEAADQ